MATVDLHREIARITIRFDATVPDELLACGSLALVNVASGADGARGSATVKTQSFEFPDGKRVVVHAHPEAVLALLLPFCDEARVGFLVNGQLLFSETVRLAPGLLTAACDPLHLNCVRAPHPGKPGRVAVFTQCFNEGRMLQMWERHYAALVGHQNLFVLDNGSTDDSCAQLNPRTSVTHMPGGALDHWHFAQTQGYFQRFLLQKYDWVIKVDTDEFLSLDGDLVETLQGMAPGVLAAERAIAVVQDRRSEAGYDPTRPLGAQRQHYVHEYNIHRKPALGSSPMTWTPGNHATVEPCGTLPGSTMVHMRFVDLDLLLQRNQRWAAMTQSARDAALTDSVAYLGDGQNLQQLFELTAKEFDGRLAEARVAAPPQVLELCFA